MSPDIPTPLQSLHGLLGGDPVRVPVRTMAALVALADAIKTGVSEHGDYRAVRTTVDGVPAVFWAVAA